jgi:hypothetical protein
MSFHSNDDEEEEHVEYSTRRNGWLIGIDGLVRGVRL